MKLRHGQPTAAKGVLDEVPLQRQLTDRPEHLLLFLLQAFLLPLRFLVSLGFFETCYLPRYFNWALGHKGPSNEFLNYTSLVEMFRYFPFFLFDSCTINLPSGCRLIQIGKSGSPEASVDIIRMVSCNLRITNYTGFTSQQIISCTQWQIGRAHV